MLLREKDKQQLIQYFCNLNIPVEVWAYGSRVNGTAHSGSDLDLVIRSQDLSPLPIADYTELLEKIRDSNIPILVELRDWARLPESFHKQILLQHEVLFECKNQQINEPQVEYNPKTNTYDVEEKKS